MMNASVDNGGEEDAEDSSSSETLNGLPNQFRSALDEFREKWQKELKSSDSNNTIVSDDPKNSSQKDKVYNNTTVQSESDNDDEERAKVFFMQGIEYEKRGKVYDALRFYRRAIQIVPDIEFRIYEMAKTQHKNKSQTQSHFLETNNNVIDNHDEASNNTVDNTDFSCGEEDLSNVDLRIRFEHAISKNDGKLIERANSTPGLIITEAHISDLPMEIVLYILRWVVSSQLDVRSLEQCARVCKGLYLCARDEEIWKSACLKVWGVNTGLLKNSFFPTWRRMFIERHRIHFNGCYISKTSYLRYGENSFQDQFYRPVQLVEYYRYIRFLPDGTVIMMTSADEPAQTVGKLNHINQLRSDTLKGHYRLHGDLIIIMLKRFSKSQNIQVAQYTKKRVSDSTENTNGSSVQTFYIELKILSAAKRRFCQLQWKHYSIIQIKNKKEISTDFELTTAKYPPLWFSKVKSYHLESEMPLK